MRLSQKEFLEANVGNPDYYKECKSLFPCGSPLESTKGWEDKLSGNVAKAKELLAEAGYDGTPVVLAAPDRHRRATTTSPPSPSRSSRRAGSRSTCSRWTGRPWWRAAPRRMPPDKGGWSAFFTSWGSTDVLNPVSAAFLNASCDKATFGWPCDETLEKLRDAYASETDPAKQKAIAEQVSCACWSIRRFAPLGQFTTPTAIRSQHRRPAAHALAGAVERREEVAMRAPDTAGGLAASRRAGACLGPPARGRDRAARGPCIRTSRSSIRSGPRR